MQRTVGVRQAAVSGLKRTSVPLNKIFEDLIGNQNLVLQWSTCHGRRVVILKPLGDPRPLIGVTCVLIQQLSKDVHIGKMLRQACWMHKPTIGSYDWVLHTFLQGQLQQLRPGPAALWCTPYWTAEPG